MTIQDIRRLGFQTVLGGGTLAGLLLGWTTSGSAWAQGPMIQNGPPSIGAQPTPGGIPPGGAPQVQRNFLNKRIIQLPIQINDSARASIQEIHLYTKERAAAPWVLREKAAQGQKAFTFQAPADGEYRFTMVTIDRQGRSYPADVRNEQAGLVVIIDTLPPSVELVNLGATAEGHLIQCDFSDANLDISRLRFTYQSGDMAFRPLEPVPGRGNVFCIPAQVVHTGLIQVIAEDLAGNQTTRQENLRSMKTSAPMAVIAPPNSVPSVPPEIKAPLPTEPPTPVGNAPRPLPVDAKPPIDNAPRPLPADLKAPTDNTPRPLPQNLINDTSSLRPLPMPAELTRTTPDRSVSMRPDGTQGPHWMGENAAPTVAPVGLTQEAPTRPAPKCPIVNNAKVFLDYQIENGVQSNVATVEIWLTRDQGRTWHKHAQTAGNKTPIEVNLPGEGVYGLTLIANNGKTTQTPPAAGDQPDSWIEVDTTKPLASINDIQTTNDKGQPTVQIRWTVQDKNLAKGPVDLQYAATPQGPWLAIAQALPADGLHRWTPPANIGSHVHVRLIASDAAGNRTIVGTSEPVAIAQPRAVIRAISTGGAQ